jgi:hypothetical protein
MHRCKSGPLFDHFIGGCEGWKFSTHRRHPSAVKVTVVPIEKRERAAPAMGRPFKLVLGRIHPQSMI